MEKHLLVERTMETAAPQSGTVPGKLTKKNISSTIEYSSTTADTEDYVGHKPNITSNQFVHVKPV